MKAVNSACSAALTVKRSRFFALVFPAAGEPQLRERIKAQRLQLRQADHHCWAARFCAADGQLTELVHNDGEVGRPGLKLLELLQRQELLGALLVSRIFGGIKLGPAGVGRAFQQAGQLALAAWLAQPSSPPRV